MPTLALHTTAPARVFRTIKAATAAVEGFHDIGFRATIGGQEQPFKHAAGRHELEALLERDGFASERDLVTVWLPQ